MRPTARGRGLKWALMDGRAECSRGTTGQPFIRVPLPRVVVRHRRAGDCGTPEDVSQRFGIDGSRQGKVGLWREESTQHVPASTLCFHALRRSTLLCSAISASALFSSARVLPGLFPACLTTRGGRPDGAEIIVCLTACFHEIYGPLLMTSTVPLVLDDLCHLLHLHCQILHGPT